MVQLPSLQSLINNFTFISEDSMTTQAPSARSTLYQNTDFKVTLFKKIRWRTATIPSQHFYMYFIYKGPALGFLYFIFTFDIMSTSNKTRQSKSWITINWRCKVLSSTFLHTTWWWLTENKNLYIKLDFIPLKYKFCSAHITGQFPVLILMTQ